MNKVLATREKLVDTLLNGRRSRIYCMKFRRAMPKCSGCGRKSKKWVKGVDDYCDKCGHSIVYDAKVYGRQIRGVGDGKVTYYDEDVGQLKCCLLNNVTYLAFEDTEMFIVRT